MRFTLARRADVVKNGAGFYWCYLDIPCLWIPAANSDNQPHDINEHYVRRHFYRQTVLYTAIVSSRPMWPSRSVSENFSPHGLRTLL